MINLDIDQERVWKLLQELRQRENNDVVREDIRILKRVLQDLIFQQQNYKVNLLFIIIHEIKLY